MLKKIINSLIIFSFSFSQNVQLNEIVSSNQNTYYDEDGDTPDWIELYNSTSNNISLNNWGLSDDIEDPFKWRIPNVILAPEDFLMILASDKDRVDMISEWETIIDIGDSWYYFVANQEPVSNWNQLSFNSSSWSIGPSGFGYGDGDDNTEITNTVSVYLIKPFSITDFDQIKKLAFHIDYDDGFVAYLNGNEFARDNIEGTPPAFNQGTLTWREAEMINGGSPSLFWVDSAEAWVNEGPNVLAIQVHNFNSSSSDLTCIPFFTLGRNSHSGSAPTIAEEIDLPLSILHSNFKISSNGETILMTDSDSVLVDSIYTGILQSDVSIGRINDGENYGLFLEPTPAETNGEESVLGVLNDITFSQESGFYNLAILPVSITTSDEDAAIYYTLDGSEPTINSILYTNNPILISENRVLRATSFKANWISSPIKTATFILESGDNNFPTIFLSTNPDNFFDFNTGIYEMGPNASQDYPHFGANFWEDWEKPIFLEVLETDGTYFSAPAGVKIFGGWSRGQSQKSLSLFARSQYGASEFNYRFFPDLELEDFQSLVLRNSGNDWNFTMLRDGFMTSIFHDVDLDVQSYRPMLVYLNGEFWGLYNLREKVNEHFIAGHHPVDPDEIDLIEVQTANEGSIDDYDELLDYVTQSDMTDPIVFDSLSKWIDIDNHIDYNIAQIFIDNRDWPGNNIKYWRPQQNDGLWRWILYDTDFGFGIPWNGQGYDYNTLLFALEENGPGWPNPPYSTFLLRKLFENSDYRDRFVNIFCDRLNTVFKSAFLNGRINEMASYIQDIIPFHRGKWPNSAQDWNYHIEILENFANNRSLYVRQHLSSFFNLSSPALVTFISSLGGEIKINSIFPDSYPWAGYYYPSVPIEIEAIPEDGYRFIGWAQYSDSTAKMKVQISNNSMITALFEEIPGDATIDLVINEINYNSSDQFDTGDWVELYNNGSERIDISGWYFTDENEDNKFIFPENSNIDPNAYIVLAQNVESFLALFPENSNLYGSFNFGLSGGGEEISLYDASDALVDQVEYNDDLPWPTEPDGNGPTLELMHPDSLNEFSSSWGSSAGNGTPGYINSIFETLKNTEDEINPSDRILYSVFPNPFNSHVKIIFDIVKMSQINFTIVNILGEKVRTFENQNYSSGLNTLVWDGKNNFGQDLSTGIYFCRLKSKNIDKSIKLLYVK